MRHLNDKPYYTTQELGDLLGITSVAVYKRIKGNKIKAEMIGGSYLISRDEVIRILNVDITEEDRIKIREAVQKTINEYGNVLKLLGKE